MSSSFPLLDLPPELITRILLFARAPDLIRCLQVNKSLYNLITSTLILQYTIDAYIAGAQVLNGSDVDALTDTTLPQRLTLLRNRESAWRALRPDFRERIKVPHNASGIYDLTGGIYLLGEALGNGTLIQRTQTSLLRYVTLPSQMFEETKWEKIDLGKNIVDIGLSVYEHDLIAVLTTSPVPSDPSCLALTVSLIQLSTSQPHPLAKQPELHCHQTTRRSGRIAVSIEVAGKYLALLISFPHATARGLTEHGPRVVDRFLVYEWMEGKLLIDLPAPAPGVYTSLVFLSPTILAIANTHIPGSFDIWDLCPSSPASTLSPPTPTHILTLLLPPLRPVFRYRSISSRGEPGPYLSHSSQTHFQPNVYYNPEDAIIVFNVHMEIEIGLRWRSALVVVHRRALLSTVERFRSQFTSTPLLLSVHDNEGVSGTSINGRKIPTIPYATWGPKITRWIPAGDLSTRWITTSAGQRMVVVSDSQTSDGGIQIYDFNPNHVRKWCFEREREREVKGKGRENLGVAGKEGEGSGVEQSLNDLSEWGVEEALGVYGDNSDSEEGDGWSTDDDDELPFSPYTIVVEKSSGVHGGGSDRDSDSTSGLEYTSTSTTEIADSSLSSSTSIVAGSQHVPPSIEDRSSDRNEVDVWDDTDSESQAFNININTHDHDSYSTSGPGHTNNIAHRHTVHTQTHTPVTAHSSSSTSFVAGPAHISLTNDNTLDYNDHPSNPNLDSDSDENDVGNHFLQNRNLDMMNQPFSSQFRTPSSSSSTNPNANPTQGPSTRTDYLGHHSGDRVLLDMPSFMSLFNLPPMGTFVPNFNLTDDPHLELPSFDTSSTPSPVSTPSTNSPSISAPEITIEPSLTSPTLPLPASTSHNPLPSPSSPSSPSSSPPLSPSPSHQSTRPHPPTLPHLTIVTSPSTIFSTSPTDTFAEPVTSELPFVVYQSDNASLNGQGYEGVLMDEERILGLKTDDHDNITMIDVFHFG